MTPATWLQAVLLRARGRLQDVFAAPPGASAAGNAPASSGDAELAANQVELPFPRWALNGMPARTCILDHVPRGGVGAEVGVFRGHFSELILAKTAPRKFYMIDPWTTGGELFPWADDYTCNGKLPTATARREAQLRAAKFPGTETVIIEGKFPDCRAQIAERLDWIYIDASHRYKETLVELKAAAEIVKRDGLILGDDYYPDRTSKHHGVFRAVNEFVKTSPYEFVAAGQAAQWCLRRTDVATVPIKGERSIKEQLAAGQAKFPYPRRAFDDMYARQAILRFASQRSVGAEVGAFRGHFSDIMLGRLMPKKFFMIDAWAKRGEFFEHAGDPTKKRKFPTQAARQEAVWRAQKHPNTETVLVDDEFRNWAAGADAERVAWIYLHSGLGYRQVLQRLVTAA